MPGYTWGAGHAMELAYMWPSFNNGLSPYDEFTPAQLQLSGQMVRCWERLLGMELRWCRASRFGSATSTTRSCPLRPGDASVAIPNSEFGAEHNCSFWDSIPGAIGG